MADDSVDSTVSDLAERPAGRLARWTGRVGVAAIFGVVLLAASGLLGVRTATVEADGGGYNLEVEHVSIARAGEPAVLHLRVKHPGGFDGPVQLGLCDDWFDHLDFQSWYPTPSAETGSRGRLVYEFDPPPGDVLEVSLDARAAPGQFGGVERCEVAVLEEDEPAVSVSFRTWRMP